MGRHLPRPGPPPAQGPSPGGRAAGQVPDPGLRRPVAAGQAHRQGPGARRGQVAGQAVPVVHQQAEGRGPQGRQPRGFWRGIHEGDDPRLRGLRGGLRARRHGGFRRAAAQIPRIMAETPGTAAALPAPLPPRAGGRVPGYQRYPVCLAAHAGRA